MPDPVPFGVGGPAEPMIESGLPGVLSGIMNFPKHLIDQAAQFDPNDIHGSTARVAPAAAEMAVALMGGGAPAAEKGAAGIFGGKLALTADHKALQEAERMLAGGKRMDDVIKDTKWYMDPTDSKWKFEIPDNRSVMKYMPEKVGDTAIGSLDSLMSHPDAFRAYPDLKSLNLYLTKDNAKPRGSGQYTHADERMRVNAPDWQAARDVSLHEMQHGIQHLEGFSPGANPEYYAGKLEKDLRAGPDFAGVYDYNKLKESARDLYWRTSGEVEARNVQRRKDFSPLERSAQPPWTTHSVAYRNQLVFDPVTETIRALKQK